jgi:hypothetical protein
MTGVVVFTAGREDAYEDYKRSVRDGHPINDYDQYLGERTAERLLDAYPDGIAHVWGTSVENTWNYVEPGDIALVYRDGGFIARADVLSTEQNYDFAEEIFNFEGNPWDPENPWEYLVYLTDIEEIEVSLQEFNALFDYQDDYYPQGFTRVADFRIDNVAEQHESVETALADLTDTGRRVHKVDEQDRETETLPERLVDASRDGDQATEFEKYVAEAFAKLGCETEWIEGGGDTDVRITEPIDAIVEMKSRSNGKLAKLDVRVEAHRQQHGADYILVVAPGFSPGAVEDADQMGITLLDVPHLNKLLGRRETFGVPPEIVFEYVLEPGAFQDDRLDQLDTVLDERVDAEETVRLVVEALDRVSATVESARDIWWMVQGMIDDDESPPSQHRVDQSLRLLEHPLVGVVEETDGEYELATSAENALEALGAVESVIEQSAEESD